MTAQLPRAQQGPKDARFAGVRRMIRTRSRCAFSSSGLGLNPRKLRKPVKLAQLHRVELWGRAGRDATNSTGSGWSRVELLGSIALHPDGLDLPNLLKVGPKASRLRRWTTA
jgi:hypothetical protein